MTKIIVGEDCGNSPRNLFIEKMTAAFAKRDTLIEGKDNFGEALERMKNEKIAELSIRHIATHGKAGAVDGTVILEDGTICAFCDVYEFNGVKASAVKEITSYLIEINHDS
jgi:hypothetical protein